MKMCPNHHPNPDDAKFCRVCGERFAEHSSLPFNLRYPELHLRPISEYPKLSFWFNKPDYVEDPSESDDEKYLYIVKDGKIGILYWNYEKHWYGDKNDHERIIPCEYDRIIKHEGMFECHKGSEVVYIDKSGTILK